jgi:hypothetical protein
MQKVPQTRGLILIYRITNIFKSTLTILSQVPCNVHNRCRCFECSSIPYSIGHGPLSTHLTLLLPQFYVTCDGPLAFPSHNIPSFPLFETASTPYRSLAALPPFQEEYTQSALDAELLGLPPEDVATSIYRRYSCHILNPFSCYELPVPKVGPSDPERGGLSSQVISHATRRFVLHGECHVKSMVPEYISRVVISFALQIVLSARTDFGEG